MTQTTHNNTSQTATEKTLVSVVIPCYYSEKSIAHVVEMTLAEFDAHNGYVCEFVLVNDGSTDKTFEEIKRLCATHPSVIGVNLIRNFGQHNALMAALHYTSGDYILAMDDDMQTHPSQAFKLIDKISEGYDLVYGHYGKRKNSAAKNLTSKLNEVSSRILLRRPKDITSSNYWIITKKVAEETIKYTGSSPYIDGIFYQITHNIANVEVEHHERETGSSGYTLKKLVHLWLAYWNYSVVPLRIASVVGGAAAAVGFIATLVTVLRKVIDPSMMMGWASTICVITFFAGAILMCLGIIGEYVGKILLSLNNTPQYIVREVVNAESSKPLNARNDT